MASKASTVLAQLEELRSMLGKTTLGHATPYAHVALKDSPGSLNSTWQTPQLPFNSTTISSSRATERLGRALEAAEEEMDAAMARQADILNSQLRAREVDLAEALRSAASLQSELAATRAQAAAAQAAAAADAAELEARVASREAELSSLQAELLALRAEADDLKHRLADGHAALNRADDALSTHTLDLSNRLAAAATEAQAAAAAAAYERHQRDIVRTQLADSQAQLQAARDELQQVQEELRHTQQEAALQAESAHQLQEALQRTASAAASLKEAKDLEISELRQRLRAERAVRKSCEAWLRSELQSKEEMEALFAAVKDVVSGGSGSGSAAAGGDDSSSDEAVAAELRNVELLLSHMNEQPNLQQQQTRQPPTAAIYRSKMSRRCHCHGLPNHPSHQHNHNTA